MDITLIIKDCSLEQLAVLETLTRRITKQDAEGVLLKSGDPYVLLDALGNVRAGIRAFLYPRKYSVSQTPLPVEQEA